VKRVGVVALNTFREAVRDRVLYNLVFFALVMIAASILVGQVSIGIHEMVIVTLGLSAISVIGLLIAVFIGVGLVSKEMEKRTLYALLAKPVRRWEFLLGKFGGLLLTLAVNTMAMSAGLLLALRVGRLSNDPLEGPVLVAVYFILLKLAMVVALALLFSCYTTPLLSILCTAGLYVAGLFVSQMRNYHSDTISPALQAFFRWISYVLPNFENFDVMAAAAHGRAIPGILIAQNTAYAALYCAIILTAAAAIFTKRNLK
jgi:Cu-processing system permease protein